MFALLSQILPFCPLTRTMKKFLVSYSCSVNPQKPKELYGFRTNSEFYLWHPCKMIFMAAYLFTGRYYKSDDELRGHWTGSIFKAYVPGPDGCQGHWRHARVLPFILSWKKKHVPLNSGAKDLWRIGWSHWEK